MKKFFGALGLFLLPVAALAHEVYVLPSDVVARDIAMESPNPLLAYIGNEYQFYFWGIVSLITVATVLGFSLWQSLSKRLSGPLHRLAPYALFIERVTLGLSLIAFAYNAALFGPELPLDNVAGAYLPWVQAVLYLSGVLTVLGLYTRVAALGALAVVLLALPVYGAYLFTYVAYLVVAVVNLIMGGGPHSLDTRLGKRRGVRERLRRRFEPYAMPAIRVGFGASVLMAALYAKFFHAQLALDTVVTYNLTSYFHFDPLFVVLGALIIESLIGIFFIVGMEVRWTALFFLFWLTLSLLYFGEAVWPHLALFGLNIAMLAHGYDRYTLQGYLFSQRGREPVL